jgi:UDP-N-acetylmuramoylalanine--D-glutamate ligase
MDYAEYFKDKKITVMRIGLLGRGVGDTAYMAEAGAEITVVDAAEQAVMQPSVDALAQYPNVTFKFGPYDFADFKGSDFVWVGAGAPLDEPVLVACRAAGIRLVQSAALFAELSGIPIVGVTGTRGKSTVTHMIHHVLKETFEEEILLGGNVRGLSNLQLLNQVTEDSIAVMELDSWQLQGFGWAKRSPHIAVFTNFMEDHMNYYLPKSGRSGGVHSGISERGEQESSAYDGAMNAYFADKANIFRYQDESGVLITTPEVFEWAKKLPGATVGQEVILVDESVIPEDAKLAMPGEHNRLNAALAYEALIALGLSEEEIFSGLASFPGVEGRLQYLGEINDVKIYNDNNATTPQAVVMGLKAVGNSDDKNVILIAGGAFKEIDPQVLVDEIPQYCKKVVLLEGTGTDTIKDKVECVVVGCVSDAVMAGLAYGQPGDVLLFSPGFASFGMFKNEYERNDEFMHIINENR